MSIVNMRNDCIIDWFNSEAYSDEVQAFLSDMGDKYHFKFFYQECLKENSNEKVTVVFFELNSTYDKWIEKYFKPYIKGRSNEYYLFEDYSETYLMFKMNNEGIYGLKAYEGNIQWKQLKLFRFLMNRFDEDEKLVNQIIEDFRQVQTMSEVLVVSETSLVNGYNETEIQSCMRMNGSYYEFLQENTESCLLKFKLGCHEGRAILWLDVDGLPEGCKGLVDRIYPSDNHTLVNSVLRWCSEHNYMTKQHQSYGNKLDFIYKSDLLCNQDLKLKLANPIGLNDEMPYMDTFSYYSEGDKYISNVDGDFTFDSTSGTGIGGNRCEDCGDRFHEDDMHYVENVGLVCSNCIEQYHWCEDSDRYVWHEDTYYCETNGCYYSSNTYLVYVENGRYSGYYLDDDDRVFCCELCGEYHHTRETNSYVSEDTQEVYCEYCIDRFYYCEEDSTYWANEDNYNEHIKQYKEEEQEDETRIA